MNANLRVNRVTVAELQTMVGVSDLSPPPNYQHKAKVAFCRRTLSQWLKQTKNTCIIIILFVATHLDILVFVVILAPDNLNIDTQETVLCTYLSA
jgi:hypothetical protein